MNNKNHTKMLDKMRKIKELLENKSYFVRKKIYKS